MSSEGLKYKGPTVTEAVNCFMKQDFSHAIDI